MERAKKDPMIEIWRHLQERLKEQRVNEREVALFGSFVPVLFIHLFNKYSVGYILIGKEVVKTAQFLL